MHEPKTDFVLKLSPVYVIYYYDNLVTLLLLDSCVIPDFWKAKCTLVLYIKFNLLNEELSVFIKK